MVSGAADRFDIVRNLSIQFCFPFDVELPGNGVTTQSSLVDAGAAGDFDLAAGADFRSPTLLWLPFPGITRLSACAVVPGSFRNG